MQQLTFELVPAESPSFANFLPGRNSEAVAALQRLAAGDLSETGVLLWGAPGSGRSHLLRATVAAATRSRAVLHLATPAQASVDPPGPGALVVVDDVGGAGAQAQGRLFTLFNRLKESGGQLLCAADVPPGRLPLRDDLRTRLGWGLVFEVLPLADADKPAALARYADERGFQLSADVASYLLSHGRRDMTSLMAALAALDRYSLASKRPVTVPLLREWLQRALIDNDSDKGPAG